MKGIDKTAFILADIGAINWGLAQLGWNAVDKLIGSWAGATASMVVYYIIALCGIWGIIKIFSK